MPKTANTFVICLKHLCQLQGQEDRLFCFLSEGVFFFLIEVYHSSQIYFFPYCRDRGTENFMSLIVWYNEFNELIEWTMSSLFDIFHWKWKWKLLSLVWSFATPMDYTVHGILQARVLEWVAFPFSRGSSLPRDRTQISLTAGRFFTSWATH